MNKHILILTVAVLFFKTAPAQQPTKVELIHANTLEGDEKLGKDVRRLLGDVQFKHDNVLMYCDSAWLYAETNSLDAFGHVRIHQGDTITLTGDLLKYDGNTKNARLFNNIYFKDRQMTLITQTLVYNLNSEVAEYTDGGKIVDTANVLVSEKGNYLAKEKKLIFKKKVVLTNPNYIMRTDTLHYSTLSKTAFFFGPCTITSTAKDSSVIYCENGWYNTESEKSYFGKDAWIQSKEQKLSGDSLLYDRKEGIGRAFRNVAIQDTLQDVIISGDYGLYDEKKQKSFVTGKTLLTQVFEKDSMFMHADTLYALNDTVQKNKSYIAYYGVKLFKSDLQGRCDSLVYNSTDSIIRLFNEPVLWSGANQLTSEFISIQMANKKIDKMFLKTAAFICSKEDTVRYNQIKGKDMTGYFTDNKLYRISVDGNGQSIYYAHNKKNQLTGVNRADCSNMEISVKENKVQRLKLIEKPDATFYPINELKPEELKLKGFTWKENLKPKSKEEIF